MTELIHQFPEGEHVVAMVTFRGIVIVATDRHLYRLSQDTKSVQLMRLQMLPPETP